jgi:hypothetical protein
MRRSPPKHPQQCQPVAIVTLHCSAAARRGAACDGLARLILGELISSLITVSRNS